MTIVNTFILGLNLFSDIGIGPSIIQSKNGNDRNFLNTAWTIQVGRGFALWIVACLMAIPAANFFGEPIIAYALPVSGLTALLAGFNSTKLATANRQLLMRQLTVIDFGAYVVGVIVMLVWAWASPTIWAPVAGGLVTSALMMSMSHLVLKGEGNRLRWDTESALEIWKFGRWIFFSTALTFLATQSDKLVIGRIMDTEFLGILAPAYMLARMLQEGMMQLGYKVLFPSYAELDRKQPERLYPILRQSRLALIALGWAGSFVFIFFGKSIIELLYDERYFEAGWMLEILAVGTLVGVLSVTYDHVLVAKGKTFTVAVLMGIQFVLTIVCIYLGNIWGGGQGVIIGLASVGWLIYPFKAIWLRRYKLWQAEVDLPVIGLAILVVVYLYLI
jgi:O-antigen/teichoic acid export membrane protein